MIFEQAFFALPEFLVGTGFARYETEGTLVMAFSMAVLQELNGRNVNNPISLISAEKAYADGIARTADLHFNRFPLGTLNERLAAFGVRQQSWLEAKFFRKKDATPTLDKTAAAYVLLRDLLRLCILPPQTIPTISTAAYALHVYEGSPSDHLAFERNPTTPKTSRVPRGWLTALHVAGAQTLSFGPLDDEPQTFDKEVGSDLRGLTAKIDVMTYVAEAQSSAYKLYLTRVESFEIAWNGHRLVLDTSATAESSPGAWEQLRNALHSALQK